MFQQVGGNNICLNGEYFGPGIAVGKGVAFASCVIERMGWGLTEPDSGK